MNTTQLLDTLEAPYDLTDQQIAQFREDGFIKLKNVLSAQCLAYYGDAITDFVKQHNDLKDIPMDQRDTYQKAFIQVENLWPDNETVRELSFSKRLAKIATELLEINGVRMFHDQALYKEPSGGFTPWHADQYYWPLQSDRTVTVWIPLDGCPQNMGPLSFAKDSQNMQFGRDLKISDDSEAQLASALKEEGYEVIDEPFDLGEVSFHLGWNYHRAGQILLTPPDVC